MGHTWWRPVLKGMGDELWLIFGCVWPYIVLKIFWIMLNRVGMMFSSNLYCDLPVSVRRQTTAGRQDGRTIRRHSRNSSRFGGQTKYSHFRVVQDFPSLPVNRPGRVTPTIDREGKSHDEPTVVVVGAFIIKPLYR